MARLPRSAIARRAGLILLALLLTTAVVVPQAGGFLGEIAPPASDVLVRQLLGGESGSPPENASGAEAPGAMSSGEWDVGGRADALALLVAQATAPATAIIAAPTVTSAPPTRTTAPSTPTSTPLIQTATTTPASGLQTPVPSIQIGSPTAPAAAGLSSGGGEPIKAALATTSRAFVVPRVVRDSSGVNSILAIFNASSAAASATVRILDGTGREVGSRQVSIPVAGLAQVAAEQLIATGTLTGSALVSADAEIAVAVEERGPSGSVQYEAVDRPAPVVAFPLVARSTGGTTTMVLSNATDRAGQVTAQFIPATGAPISAPPIPLAAFASATLDLASVAGLPPDFTGSARLEAGDVAIAAAIIGSIPGGGTAAYAGFTRGVERLVLPNASSARGGSTAGLFLQNLAEGSVEVTIERRKGADETLPADRRSVARGAALDLDRLGLTATEVQSVTIAGPPGSRLAAVAAVPGGVIRGVPAESREFILPAAAISSGVVLQNLGSAPDRVGIMLLDAEGRRVGSRSVDLEPGASASLTRSDLQVPTGFGGSAVVSAMHPVGVVAR